MRLVHIAIAIWFAAIATTLGAVWHYKSTAGPDAAAPTTWPSASTIRRVSGVPDVIMFAHPQCPCTRASMAELARLSDELDGAARIHVVIVRPEGTSPGFEEGAIADRAAALRGADVVIDDRGVEAERFGAIVSGTTLVYAATGELLFSGGLTTARGHEGRGPAHDRIVALVGDPRAARAAAPTFGCTLGEVEVRTP